MYRFSRMNGLEDLEFAEALRQEPSRERAYGEKFRFSRPFSYFTRGLYAQHLQSWLDRFPREHILIKRYEDLETDPSAVVADVHRFLGLEPRPADAEDIGVVNAAEPETVDVSLLTSLRHRYAEPNQRLYDLLGTTLWSDE